MDYNIFSNIAPAMPKPGKGTEFVKFASRYRLHVAAVSSHGWLRKPKAFYELQEYKKWRDGKQVEESLLNIFHG